MGGRDPGHGDNVNGSQSRRLTPVLPGCRAASNVHSVSFPTQGGAVRRDPASRGREDCRFGLIMIEDPPPLVFAPVINRPPAKLVERFRGAPTSFIVDALGGTGALDWRIKPLVGRSLVGVALTCDCGPLDNLAFMAAIAECRPGDVLVVATGGYTGAAVTGDLLIGVAKNRGAAGFVTDGLVRDLDDLETVGLPILRPASRRIRRNDAVLVLSACRSSAAAFRSPPAMWWSAIATALWSFRAPAYRRPSRLWSTSKKPKPRPSSGCAQD